MDKKSRDLVMGKLYLKNKDYKMAEKNLLDYLNLSPEDFQALKMLAQVYESLNNYQKAFEFYERSYLVEPERKGTLLDICRLLLVDNSGLNHVDRRKWLKLAAQAFPTNPIVTSLRDTLPVLESTPAPDKMELQSELLTKLDRLDQRLTNIEEALARLAVREPEKPATNSHNQYHQPALARDPAPEPVKIQFPGPQAVMPKLEAATPKLEAVLPKPQAFTPKPEPVVAKPEAVIPKPEPVISKPLAFIPKPEPVISKPEPVISKPEPVISKPPAFIPRPEAVTPKPVTQFSQPITSPPKPASPSPPKPVLSSESKIEQPSFFTQLANSKPDQPKDSKPSFVPLSDSFSFGLSSGGGNLFADGLKKFNLPTEGSWASFGKAFDTSQPKPTANEDKDDRRAGDGDGEGDDGVVEAQELPIENTCEMQPIEIKSGEEDEDIIFEHRCKLFRFRDKEYKERGLGNIKMLQHRTTGAGRLIMRRDLVNLVCLNCWSCENIKRVRDVQVQFTALDVSDGEPDMVVFVVKFKTPELTDTFMSHLNKLFPSESE